MATPASFMTMQISPLTPSIGAEVSGVDLLHATGPEIETLRRAWLQHKVLFITHQTLDLDQFRNISARFGSLMQLPYVQPVAGFPEIIRVLKRADETDMGVFGGEWHSDFSFLTEPPSASLLYSMDVPPVGGDTLWVDMALAWRKLPSALRDQLVNRTAMHIGKPYGVAHAPDESTQFRGSIGISRNNPEADQETPHPVVCRHPDTGEEMLFVNPTYTTRIVGMEASEGEALLESVYAHCTRPEFACRWRWRRNVLAMWDNRCTMHYAVNDYDGYRRELVRTTLHGEAPRSG